METRAIQGLHDLALQPDRDRRQGGGQQGQRQRQVPEPADLRAAGPAEPDGDGSIAHLLGITLWRYQDEGSGLNISI